MTKASTDLGPALPSPWWIDPDRARRHRSRRQDLRRGSMRRVGSRDLLGARSLVSAYISSILGRTLLVHCFSKCALAVAAAGDFRALRAFQRPKSERELLGRRSRSWMKTAFA